MEDHEVIKYALALSYLYVDYNLVYMKTHDINLAADLTALDPNAPSPYDGTGTIPPSEEQELHSGLSDAALSINIYWTGWWPLLHFEFCIDLVPEDIPEGHPAKDAEGASLYGHIAKNLLRETEEEELTILDYGELEPESNEILNQQVGAIGGLILDFLCPAF